MKKPQRIVSIDYLLASSVVVVLSMLFSCDVFMPNFLVGTWYASGAHGDEKLVFTKKGDFILQFYDEHGKVQKITGKYQAGKSVVQLRYKNEAGTYVKAIAPYKMYGRSMDFIMKGKTTKFYKF